ncbi:MAG: hypothetical protein NTZ33_04800 [Bacteroidetes bacterium]|nr:hypothetical protein [Bacteroidota bacterium]
MKKPIFIPHRWVKFKYNDEICIGLTFYEDSLYSENYYQLVFFMTKELSTETIEFSECNDLTYLEFVKKPKYIKDLKVNNETLTLETQIDLLIRPEVYKNTITVLAKNLSNRLYFN